MAAEIVMIIQDQDARRGAGARAIEMRRREAADSAAHNHEVVTLACFHRDSRRLPERAVAQGVSGIERSGMATAHTGKGGRVVAGRILRKLRGVGASEKPQTHRDAVQEIAPGNRPAVTSHIINVSAVQPSISQFTDARENRRNED
jgi:hypothetical protein